MGEVFISLDHDDPVVFAKCSGTCSRMGPGASIENIFYRAYSKRRWEKRPICDNCKSPMKELYRIEE